jgi:hypothetical protein
MLVPYETIIDEDRVMELYRLGAGFRVIGPT